MTISSPSTDAPASSAPFPVTRGRARGYETRAVDAFLARARRAFEQDDERNGEYLDVEDGDGGAGNEDVLLTSDQVRLAAFPLVRHGYAIAPVDAALTRIEDAFAARERGDAVSTTGAHAWVESSKALAQEILDRLSRPRRRRFARARGLGYGYRVDEVDLVADQIAGYLETGRAVTVGQVRGVAFRMQRRGYREAQVDAVLDAVVEVMLAVE